MSEDLENELQQLREENAVLGAELEAVESLPDRDELEQKRDRIFSNLKLGKQAPGYKTAKKVLDQFIRELSP